MSKDDTATEIDYEERVTNLERELEKMKHIGDQQWAYVRRALRNTKSTTNKFTKEYDCECGCCFCELNRHDRCENCYNFRKHKSYTSVPEHEHTHEHTYDGIIAMVSQCECGAIKNYQSSKWYIPEKGQDEQD